MKPLTLKEYCPKMPRLRSKHDIFLYQINKEDWANHAEDIQEWKTLKVEIPKYQKPFIPGLYMFVKGFLP